MAAKKKAGTQGENPIQTKTRTIGTGITKRQVVETSLADSASAIAWFREFEARRAKHKNEFEFAVADFELWARSVLKNATDADIRSEQSEAHYANQALHLLAISRDLIMRHDAAGAAAYGVRLGFLMAEARMKFMWEPLTLKGMHFSDNKRGAARLYREALAILEREGLEYPSREVRLALKRSGVIRVEADSLRWTDDRGKKKTTGIAQFDKELSRHRQRIRKNIFSASADKSGNPHIS